MKKRKFDKKAEILTENLIFIILNLVFFSLLAVFIFIKSDSSSLVEESYAKKIALILDSVRPGMEVNLDMALANKKAKDYGGKIVDIQGNIVTVKLSQKGGYSYSFFNEANLNKTYFYSSDGKQYLFKVEPYKRSESVLK